MASSIPLTAINVVIACSAILGNGMVICVMTVRRKQFSSFTNRLIRHQSIIDFVSGVLFLTLKICINPSLFENVNESLSGELLCRFIYSGYFVWASNVASTYNLVMISLERFMATCYPVKHRNHCSFFRIKVSMCAAWIIGFTEALLLVTTAYHADQGRCSLNSHVTDVEKVTIMLLYSLVEYLIPVILMTFAYVKILVILQRKLAGTADTHQQRNGVLGRAKRNVLVTMLLTGSLFVICWTPLETLRFLYSIGIVKLGQPLVDIIPFFKALVMCNMCVNPVIYCFKYEHFRVQLMQLVRKRFRHNRVHTGEESNAPTLSIMDPLQQTAITQST